MNIKQQLVSNNLAKKVSFGTGNPKRYITVHQTGNTSRGANAQTHANLQSRGWEASWHWQVDDKEAIQSFAHDWRLWHAGDGTGKGNMESIGIEACINSDGNYVQSVKNLAQLVAKIMKDENISIDRVVQHNYWSGKNCPAQIRAGQAGIDWNKFIGLVKGDASGGTTTTKPKPQPQKPAATSPRYYEYPPGRYRVLPEIGLNVRDKPDTGNIKTALPKGSAFNAVEQIRGGVNGVWLKRDDGNYISAQQGNVIHVKRIGDLPQSKPTAKTSINEIAQEVIDGKWGNGSERKSRLEKAGYNYTTVQNKVNALLGISGGSTKRTGKWRFDTPVKIRSGPSTSHEQVGLYKAGDTVNLDGVETGSGYIWGTYIAYSGARRYVALQPVNGTPYGKWI